MPRSSAVATQRHQPHLFERVAATTSISGRCDIADQVGHTLSREESRRLPRSPVVATQLAWPHGRGHVQVAATTSIFGRCDWSSRRPRNRRSSCRGDYLDLRPLRPGTREPTVAVEPCVAATTSIFGRCDLWRRCAWPRESPQSRRLPRSSAVATLGDDPTVPQGALSRRLPRSSAVATGWIVPTPVTSSPRRGDYLDLRPLRPLADVGGRDLRRPDHLRAVPTPHETGTNSANPMGDMSAV